MAVWRFFVMIIYKILEDVPIQIVLQANGLNAYLWIFLSLGQIKQKLLWAVVCLFIDWFCPMCYDLVLYRCFSLSSWLVLVYFSSTFTVFGLQTSGMSNAGLKNANTAWEFHTHLWKLVGLKSSYILLLVSTGRTVGPAWNVHVLVSNPLVSAAGFRRCTTRL